MKTFIQFVNEKRKNPDKNPKIGIVQELTPYFDDPDVYISMRNEEKLGIYPTNKYNTPTGIYSYPLWAYKDEIKKEGTFNDVLPFKATDPIYYIFKPKKSANIIKLNDVTEEWVIDFFNKVFKEFHTYRTFFLPNVDKLKEAEVVINKTNKIIDKINQCKTVDQLLKIVDANKTAGLTTKILNREKEGKSFEQIKKDPLNYYRGVRDGMTEILMRQRELFNAVMDNLGKFVYEKGQREAKRPNTPGGVLWWFTWYFDSTPDKWASFIRKIGIDGFVDNGGKGIIHANELYQAVFFAKSKIDIIKSANTNKYDELKEYVFTGRGKAANFINLPTDLQEKAYSFFIIGLNKLESLKGSPKEIAHSFIVRNCDSLKTLKGGPEIVGGDFSLNSNKNLVSLEGAPIKVGGDCDLSKNKLTSLEGAPKEVEGAFDCFGNNLTSLKGAPKEVGGYFDCSKNTKKFTEEEVRAVCNVKGNVFTE